jgi:hypothetical protein
VAKAVGLLFLSTDLTHLDYFVWGHVKSPIYDTHVDIEFELLENFTKQISEDHD